MYAVGRGVSQSDAAAGKWYHLAAEQGNIDAQVSLGEMYAVGRGVSQSDTEAGKWFRLAADQGQSDAQWILAMMHAEGRGVQKNTSEASKWFRKASEVEKEERRRKEMEEMWGRLLQINSPRRSPQKPSQICGVQALAHKLVQSLTESAKRGNVAAQYGLGLLCAIGHWVPQSDDEAVKWCRLAAEQGDAYAQNELGELYATGCGVPQDDAEAKKWYQKAADQGHEEAQRHLEERTKRSFDDFDYYDPYDPREDMWCEDFEPEAEQPFFDEAENSAEWDYDYNEDAGEWGYD